MFLKRKKEKGQVWLGTPAGPLELMVGRDLWGHKEVTLVRSRSVLSFKSCVCCLSWCVKVKKKKSGMFSDTNTFLSNHALGVGLHACRRVHQV